MLTVTQQVGWCYFAFCRYAFLTSISYAFLACKLPVSPPTSTFVIMFYLNLVLHLTWALCGPRRCSAFDWDGQVVLQRWNTRNLRKGTMWEGTDSLRWVMPFEHTSSKHISPKLKKAYDFCWWFFPFHTQPNVPWIGNLPSFSLFKELPILFPSKSALLW